MELVRYWKRFPPAHLALFRLVRVVEGLAGVKASEPEAEAPKLATPQDIRDLAALFGKR